MAWLTLFFAGLLEMAWALFLKQSDGLTRLVPTIGFVVTLALSMFLLAIALKTLPVGSAYAVWTGIGPPERRSWACSGSGSRAILSKILSLLMLIAGLIGLRVTSGE